jgi:hypothetical protein
MSIRTNDPTGMGWSQCTARGSEEAQLRMGMRLSLREKLLAVEALADLSRCFLNRLKRQGKPYIDPHTGELIPCSGTKTATRNGIQYYIDPHG